MTFSENGVVFLEDVEGKRLQVYRDSAGRPTIGVGHLLTSRDPVAIWYARGITDDECTALLYHDIAQFEYAVNHLVTVTLNQNQFDALVSFAFNEGSHALATSHLLKYLNAGNYQDAAAQFLVWDKEHVNGVLTFSQGLHNRRVKEQTLFNTPIAA